MAGTLAAELHEVARMVRRLGPDRRDPEAFHLMKSEAAARLARIAREIERDAYMTMRG